MGDEVDDYYRELPDGTIKQRNPFTGTQVWTVPGRGARPLATPVTDARPLSADDRLASCAFCPSRLRQTPPEKARLVADAQGSFFGHRLVENVPSWQLDDTVAQFRRIPNLFEILPWSYWRVNHGMTMTPQQQERQEAYLAHPDGRAHVCEVLDAVLAANDAGLKAEDLTERELRERSAPFFAGGHDVIVALSLIHI